ncbi:MAG: 16S rRNA (uracil(1498)-N(3))-methyltransferase [Planctomycetaceae bacterium]|nr:16S rRNA (uracil(1498)-N(3))-methyltransferase [Planctomycetaceae bacterium]
MTHRAYCSFDDSTPSVTLEETEAHHVLHVLRMKSGDRLELFDGLGRTASGKITAVTRRSVDVAIDAQQYHAASDFAHLCVAVAPPKGDRLKWMLEKLTELGVSEITLLQTERTVVTPAETKVEKLKANIISAGRQSKRVFLPILQPLTPFEELLQSLYSTDTDQRGNRIVIAHPQSLQPESLKNTAVMDKNVTSSAIPEARTTLLIGPEGGFTDEEVQQAVDAGATPISWPGTILRIETAAIVFSTLLISGPSSQQL